MSFICYKCHTPDPETAITITVASDADLEGRHREAAELRATVREACTWHASPLYLVGEHEDWPGEKVWLPSYGVSVGPCEDCGQTRPCVNCR